MFALADPIRLFQPNPAALFGWLWLGMYGWMFGPRDPWSHRTMPGRNHPEDPAYHPWIVRYDEIESLLALNDRQLADIGLRRRDVEAYRDGRIKHLRRQPDGL